MEDLKDNKGRKVPFKVPEAYFDDISSRVMEKIKEEEKPTKTSVIPILKSFMWMAASFVIIFGVGRVIIPMVINPSEKLQDASTMQMVVRNDDYDTEYTDELDELNVSDEEIIEYLIERDINQESIISEY